MYFALGLFILFVCFAIDSFWGNNPKNNRSFEKFFIATQWFGSILVVASLMHFGILNMW